MYVALVAELGDEAAGDALGKLLTVDGIHGGRLQKCESVEQYTRIARLIGVKTSLSMEETSFISSTAQTDNVWATHLKNTITRTKRTAERDGKRGARLSHS